MITSPELKHGLLHRLDPFRARQPAFRTVVVGVGAKDAAVALHDPGIHADDGAASDLVSADGGAGGRHDALVVEAKRGVEAEGFLNAGVEVG